MGQPVLPRYITGLPFVSAPNKFESLAAHDAQTALSVGLYKLTHICRAWKSPGFNPRTVKCDFLVFPKFAAVQIPTCVPLHLGAAEDDGAESAEDFERHSDAGQRAEVGLHKLNSIDP
jgi:hypothetical protein